jgi:2-polyprenyl-3-methyl-5-hydroxy-6-metoxy-1,4-benzoquinol methylase
MLSREMEENELASWADGSRISPSARRVAERFARFREPGNDAYFHALAEHLASLVEHPCLPMYFEYAITTNARGRAAVERLSREAGIGRKRGLLRRRPQVLDVGCAFGGFLVAFAEKGARVTGMEINELLLRLAIINLRSSGVDADLVKGDATAEHPGFRGRFDVITANDVVEHVPQLERFLRNLREWLTPSGVAYLEIPNGAYPPFVLKDGHHQLFGITLLDYAEASSYYSHVSPHGAAYDTFNYLDLPGYRRIFAAAGLSLTLLPETPAPASVDAVLRQLAELRGGLAAGLDTVPEPLRPLVRERVAAYLARVEAAPRESTEDREKFLLDYGVSFWVVLARRTA